MTLPRRGRAALAVAAMVAVAALAACTGGAPGAGGTRGARPSESATATVFARPTAAPAGGTPLVSERPSGGHESSPSRPSPARGTPADRSPTGAAVTIAFAGDVHFEGASRRALGGLGPESAVLSAADLAIVNLETAITERGSAEPKEFNFRAPPTAFGALRDAGIDVATMANNHGLDYGLVGLDDSLAAATAASFPVIGIGRDHASAFAPYRVTISGQRIAVIGATQVLDDQFLDSWAAGPRKPGLASAKRVDDLLAAVRAARAHADTVVVFLHWGAELAACPTAPQRALAPALEAAGADVIVGSHAHVQLGGGWAPDGAYVDYGLGNFVFYASGGPGARTGVLVLTVRGRAVTRAEWKPAVISGGLPVPLAGAAAAEAVAGWNALRGCTDLAASPPR
jgi:poly-gamma-glutamate capsule biosynthesis protein CapA/YwtB (metallophosphatase superfamily)